MAQLERNVKSPSGGTRDQVTVEYLLQAYDTHGQARESPTHGKNHDQEEDRDDHQTKKSVLAKVKEKAKKLKQSLSMKRHNQDDDNAMPARDANAGEDDDRGDYHTEEEEQEEDPEYFGAPMYESEMAPEDVKEAARQNPREDVEILEKHVLMGKGSQATTEEEDDDQEANPKEQITSKTITESVTEKLAPAYAMATEATQIITSKIQDMAIATSLVLERKGSIGEQKWDKGVSVKEYLMQKLEPGEEERALSQVIAEAMSPRKDPGDKGVVEKVRGTVSSLFGKEESSTSLPFSSSTTTATSPLPSSSASSSASRASNIPVSWNAYQAAVEEENEGRVLQAN